MRHTFQITVDYSPDAAQLATLRAETVTGESEAKTRKGYAKLLVLAQIDLHPDLKAITRPNLITAATYARTRPAFVPEDAIRAASQRPPHLACRACYYMASAKDLNQR